MLFNLNPIFVQSLALWLDGDHDLHPPEVLLQPLDFIRDFYHIRFIADNVDCSDVFYMLVQRVQCRCEQGTAFAQLSEQFLRAQARTGPHASR